MPIATITIPATRFTKPVSLSVAAQWGTNPHPSLSVCAFVGASDPTNATRDFWIGYVVLGGTKPNKAQTAAVFSPLRIWGKDGRAAPEQDEPKWWSVDLWIDDDNVEAECRTQATYDDDDDYSRSAYSRLLRISPKHDASIVCEAIEEQFSGRDDCWHDYDCCGCRTFSARNATQIGRGLYAYDFIVSRNY